MAQHRQPGRRVDEQILVAAQPVGIHQPHRDGKEIGDPLRQPKAA